MPIVAITGDHPRHSYLVQQIASTGLLSGWIREKREAFTPEPAACLPPDLASLFRHHFAMRAAAEERHFGNALPSIACDTLDVTLDGLNGASAAAFIRRHAPKIIISFGCHKLEAHMLNAEYAWNVHGGLSPWYRGAGTHFWPSYMLEPQMTGVTLHETTEAIDGGAIIHQTGVDLVRGDGLHDLACRAGKKFGEAIPSVLKRAYNSANKIEGVTQATAGRIWTTAMWRAEHLIPIYRHYTDTIVSRTLDGEIEGRTPNLVTLD